MKIYKPIMGAIIGVQGCYDGAVIRIDADEKITFGRDPETCQIVIDEEYTHVSRTHCTVCLSAKRGGYELTDHSTNGTLVNGELLPHGKPVFVPRNSTICLDEKNIFELT